MSAVDMSEWLTWEQAAALCAKEREEDRTEDKGEAA